MKTRRELIRLLCLAAAVWLFYPGGLARADEVSCPGRSQGFRCFRAESGTGQVASWIADINRRVPAGQDRVELRHYDNANLDKNWLWCRVNGQTVNPVRNFAREVPMSTTDYQQAYCPAGEVLRWVRQGHVYRVPVSAIPTPGERNTILAAELSQSLLSSTPPTRETLVSALTALESNETDMQGMRPDRLETAALVAAIRRSLESLPAVVEVPSEPVVREVVRQGETTTIAYVNEGFHYPWWVLALAGICTLMAGFYFGRYFRHGEITMVRRSREHQRGLTAKERDLRVSAETRLMELAREAVDTTSIVSVWSEVMSEPVNVDRVRIILKHGAAFERSQEQSGKKPMEEFLSSFGEDASALPLMKAEITRLNEENANFQGSVLEVARLTEWLQSFARRVLNFGRGCGVDPAEHPMPDLKTEDGITDFVQGVFDDIALKLRLKDDLVADKIHRQSERSKQLRKGLREGIKRHRELARRWAHREAVEIPALRETIGLLHVQLSDEAKKVGQKMGAQHRLAESLSEVSGRLAFTERELERTMLGLDSAECLVKKLSGDALLRVYDGRLQLKERPGDHFDPQDRSLIAGLCEKAESALESLMGFTPHRAPQQRGPNGTVITVPFIVGNPVVPEANGN